MKKKRGAKQSSATVPVAEEGSQEKKPKVKPAPIAGAQGSIPTPAKSGAASLGELAQRQARLEKAVVALAPKVEYIMRTLKDAEKKAEEARALPPAPQVEAGGGSPISPDILKLIEKGIDRLLTPDESSNIVDKAIIDRFAKAVTEREETEMKIGRAFLDHVKKNKFKGMIKFEE